MMSKRRERQGHTENDEWDEGVTRPTSTRRRGQLGQQEDDEGRHAREVSNANITLNGSPHAQTGVSSLARWMHHHVPHIKKQNGRFAFNNEKDMEGQAAPMLRPS